MPADDSTWLRRKAKEQLGFIDASCNLFDQGHAVEGYRIATALRVLFHSTNTSTSVIDRLNARQVKLLSTKSHLPEPFERLLKLPGVVILANSGGGLICEHLSTEGSFLFAPLGNQPTRARPLSLDDWLNENIFTKDAVSITRYQLFKWAANKDGGAHVDPDFPQAYEAYSGPGLMGVVVVGGREYPLENAHLVTLRQ